MAGRKAQDPFELWRNQQLPPPEEPTVPAAAVDERPRLELSPHRYAQRALAIEAMFDALETGDPEAFEQASIHTVNLNRRLYLEQQAEQAVFPSSLDSAIAALNLAADLVQHFGPIA